MPEPGDQHLNHGGKPIVNPYEEVKPRMSEYTASEIASLQSKLEKQLGPEYISSRPGPGGQKISYLAGEKSIQIANEVFGFNGWSSQIQNLQVDFMDEHPTTLKINLGLSVIVRVTLRDGTFHEDIGYGHIDNCKGKAAAFEKAKKSATTDALKRALRNFGNVLGNCIYDKDYLGRVTKLKVQPTKFDVERLHRHSTYAPIKKEPDAVMEETQDLPVLRHTGSAEDEFDDFDEADFSFPSDPDTHPDEVVLPATTAKSHHFNGGDGPKRPSATKSMPAPARPPQTVRSEYVPIPKSGPVFQNQPRTPNGALTRSNSGSGAVSRPQQQDTTNLPDVKQVNGGPTRISNQSSRNGGGSAPPSPGHVIRASVVAGDVDVPTVPAAVAGPGFFSAKAALSDKAEGPTTGDLPTFNPHAESPSIRRTPGIDHKSSKPLSRDGKHLPSSSQQAVAGVGGIRANIVNPQLEATRRIGAPGSPSPMANRNSYKPPTMKRMSDGTNAQRAPLGEVPTNGTIIPDGGGGDVKRQRTTGT